MMQRFASPIATAWRTASRAERSARTARRPRALLGFAMALAGLCATSSDALSAEAAEAAPPPLNIAVLVSSRPTACYDPGDVGAITTLARREADRINRQGGIHGRPVQLRFLDDATDEGRTTANLREAIGDPSMLAIIGLTSSNRAKAAFTALGPQLKDSAIPFLSAISVASLFKPLPNVLTIRASQDEDRLPIMAQFIRKIGFRTVAYAGLRDVVFSTAIGDGLKQRLGQEMLVADHRLRTMGQNLEPDDLAATVADLKAKDPDLLVVGVGSRRTEPLLKALIAAGVVPPLFVTGRIEQLPAEIVDTYPKAIYQLAWDRLPGAENDRLRRVISRDAPQQWMFEGRKNAEAPGWTSGECQPRAATITPDPLESANQRAISLGAEYADMVGLVAATARSEQPGADMAHLRRHVLKELTTRYASGRGIYKGSFETWSFEPAARTAVRTPFVVIRPPGLGTTQLAPVQFVRLKHDVLREIDTLYLDIDMIRAHRIDDNEKTFFAEFYMSMRDGRDSNVGSLEFTNAFVDPKTGGRQITVETLHDGGPSDAYPEGMKIYKVTGRFTFEPELSRYPFDTQRFAIDIQPKRADKPFVVQPPPPELRDKAVSTDGWDLRAQYVGYGEDVVPLRDAYTLEPRVVPFYKASFVWLMKRQTTDYFLRVVVPLAFILIVAYLSFFISTHHFEAIVTIQVTALLSAVALYLSLPKLDSDDATVSDRLFVFNYMVVSLMIGISILRVNGFSKRRRWFRGVLRLLHVVGIPALVALMAAYVWQLTEL